MSAWRVRDRFHHQETRWFTLLGEHLETEQGDLLEYWRVERSHSLIVLPLLSGQILLPAPMYRPGVGAATLDLPGGRVPEGQPLREVASQILQRELGIAPSHIAQLTQLNTEGWPVNSSFSNQRLFGMVAQLRPATVPTMPYQSFPATLAGIGALLAQVTCLQCRAVVWEWQAQSQGPVSLEDTNLADTGLSVGIDPQVNG